MDYCPKRQWAANLPQKERGLTYHRVTLSREPVARTRAITNEVLLRTKSLRLKASPIPLVFFKIGVGEVEKNQNGVVVISL